MPKKSHHAVAKRAPLPYEPSDAIFAAPSESSCEEARYECERCHRKMQTEHKDSQKMHASVRERGLMTKTSADTIRFLMFAAPNTAPMSS